MRRLSKTTLTATALVGLLAFPAAAEQAKDDKTMDEQAQACIDRLEEMDQRLAELGYGLAGPGGYGVYGAPYGNAGDAGVTTLRATPATDMRVLMRAGYIMARQGHTAGCESVVQTVQEIGDSFEAAMADGEYDAEELAQWRNEYLGGTVSVTELEQPLSAEEIIGADVRNTADEDLGDVENVVMSRDGEIRYLIVETGGFLGIGDEEVPVRWSDLSVTTEPYYITFVLNVSEQAFEDAPRLDDDRAAQLLSEDKAAEYDTYWDEAGLGETE